MNEIKMLSWGEYIGNVYEYLSITISSVNSTCFLTIQKWFGHIKNKLASMKNGIEIHFNQFKERAVLIIDCEEEEMIYINITINEFLELLLQLKG